MRENLVEAAAAAAEREEAEHRFANIFWLFQLEALLFGPFWAGRRLVFCPQMRLVVGKSIRD